ncbi:heavy metal translocating P-type ATPase [Caldimonas taiwanensis]|uniref:heavy metal translocating P-type ATPase n=1 Tax=Caldimonas taiwanensis TaxID=307483 RepID=UPI0009FD68E7|nr:cation-translocating P-type ATPase [Caldimonas taiwanensis]
MPSAHPPARAELAACAPSDAEAVAWDDPLEQARFTQEVPDPTGGAARRRSVLIVEGMYCAACSVHIEEALLRLPGVLQADVHPISRRAGVLWDPAQVRASDIAHAVAKAGYRAYPALSAQAEADRRRQQRQALWRLFVAGFCMMQVMMYAVPTYGVAPSGSQDMSADIWRLLQWASWLLSIPVLLFAAGPFLQGAWRDLRARRIGMDVPVALGIVVTFIASTGATFDPGGPFGQEVYFDSLTMFVFFLLAGRYLVLRAHSATAAALESLMQRLPETVERESAEGHIETLPVSRLQASDRVRVRAGQAFPADGRIEAGSAWVDEALLTGESTPQWRGPGQAVVAGSFNLSAPVWVRVERVGRDTRYARIVELMQRAATERPAFVQAVDRMAAPFLWAVLLAAALCALVWAFIDPSRSLWVAVAVLIVTCPCALSLATPSALLSAAGALARRGVLLQRLQALEALAEARVFVFDKTGTLTEDRLELKQCEVLDARWSRDQLLAHAAALAQASLHPVSRAVVEAAAPKGGLALVHEVHEWAGCGLEGRDAQGRCWRLGSFSHATDAGDARAGAHPPASLGPEAWLSVDGAVLARFEFSERLRPQAHDTIAALRAQGVQTVLLSGDRPEAVEALARRLGMDHWRGGASPEDKLAYVHQVQAQGCKLAMVGDGLNDGPVLAQADASLAMGQGAALARAQADITLMSSRLSDVVAAWTMARRTVRIIRQNLSWAAAYNALGIPLAALGWMPPWLAGLGMAASSVLVVANAWRLSRGDLPAGNPAAALGSAPLTASPGA